MRLLVLAQDYPSPGKFYAMSYVHTRNVEYLAFGHDVTVLNFSASQDYDIDGVQVVTEASLKINSYDRILSHAPNIKNHVRFISKLKNNKVTFFFHGHEVLRRTDYPPPYSWNSPNALKTVLTQAYDYFKLRLLRKWFRFVSTRNEVKMVFVSQWMQEQFERGLNLKASDIGAVAVIPNSVHPAFLSNTYAPTLIADFVTIRPLDDSKYCLDLIVKFAEANPTLKFHVFGKGRFFSKNSVPSNLVWFDQFISQEQIPQLLNQYRCALMPTRYDAQGVMMCEMATFGIPLVTSNIDICQEMLGGMDNCKFFDEEDFGLTFDISSLKPANCNHRRFDPKKIISTELSFI